MQVGLIAIGNKVVRSLQIFLGLVIRVVFDAVDVGLLPLGPVLLYELIEGLPFNRQG